MAENKYLCCIIYHCDPHDNADDRTLQLVRALAAKLEQSFPGNRIFYQGRDSRPGRSVFSEASRAVRLSDCFIVLITPEFNISSWATLVKDEAFLRNIEENTPERVLTYFVAGTDGRYADVPDGLSAKVHLYDRQGDPEALNKLIQSIAEATGQDATASVASEARAVARQEQTADDQPPAYTEEEKNRGEEGETDVTGQAQQADVTGPAQQDVPDGPEVPPRSSLQAVLPMLGVALAVLAVAGIFTMKFLRK